MIFAFYRNIDSSLLKSYIVTNTEALFMENMSLLQEIQASVTEANADIAAVLRKCKVLAVRLRSKDFQSWVDYELNGYPSKEETPEYRILRHIPSYGNFMNIAWKASSQPIPMSSIPEDLRERFDTLYLMEPISFYSSLVTQKSDEPTICFGWAPDLIAYLGDKIIEDF